MTWSGRFPAGFMRGGKKEFERCSAMWFEARDTKIRRLISYLQTP
jgi:hypothetical protein